MTNDEKWLLEEKYSGVAIEAFDTDRERLASGEPLAYVIGWVPFLDTRITLDSHPLIPRTETEYWIEKIVVEMNKRTDGVLNVLDLCAGSGCIGVAVLHKVPGSHVDFAEIDVRHHATISQNIIENKIDPARTHILGGDLFEHVTQKYDYILSNPPYVDPALDRVDASVRAHEPEQALYGGDEGFEYIQRIITDAPRFLKLGGTLVIEHEPEQVPLINKSASAAGLVTTTYPDQFGIERFTLFTCD